MQVNFHRRIGVRPGFGPFVARYGLGTVWGFRMGWASLTLTVLHKNRKERK